MIKTPSNHGLGMANNTREHNGIILHLVLKLAQNLTNVDRVQIEQSVDCYDNNGEMTSHVEPDISIWKFAQWNDSSLMLRSLQVVIEIVHTSRNVAYSTNVIHKIFLAQQTLNEAFIYDYSKKVWLRFTRTSDPKVPLVEQSDWSRLLRKHLNRFDRLTCHVRSASGRTLTPVTCTLSGNVALTLTISWLKFMGF